MSNVFTLENLKNEVERKYAPVEIDLGGGKSVVLRNVMRMGNTERAKVMEAINATQGIDTNTAEGITAMTEALKNLLLLVSDSNGKALVAAIGDDLGLAMEIMSLWSEGTQPGEASNSPS